MSNAARKRGVRIDENLFDVGVAASEGYGHDMGAPIIDIQTKPIIRAKPIDIFKIQPNPMQPRRVTPSEFRGGPLMDQIEAWLEEVEASSGRAFPLEALILGKVELRAREERQATVEELPLLRSGRPGCQHSSGGIDQSNYRRGFRRQLYDRNGGAALGGLSSAARLYRRRRIIARFRRGALPSSISGGRRAKTRRATI